MDEDPARCKRDQISQNIKNQEREVQNREADLKQRVLFLITIFRLAIPASFRFTDATELM